MRRVLGSILISAAALATSVALMSACVGYLDADAGAPPSGVEAGTSGDGGAEAAGGGDGGAGEDGGCTSGAYACAVLGDHPLLYLRLEETNAADKAHDATGHGYDGTYPSFGISLGEPGALTSDPTSHAVRFAGTTGQQISMPEGADFSGASFSVEMWIKPEPMTALAFIVDHEVFTAQRGGWDIDLQDGDIGLELFANDQTFLVTSSQGHAVTANAWHHVVAAYDATAGQGVVWVDGVYATTQRYRDDVVPKVGSWSIGKQNCTPCAGSEFKGWIDELAVYDYMLNEGTVKAHLKAR